MRQRILDLIARTVIARPLTVVAVAVLSALACGLYAVTSLRLNSDTDDLVSRDRPYMARYHRFLEEFGGLEFIFVVVDPHGDHRAGKACVEALAERLRRDRDLRACYAVIEGHEQLRVATRAMSDQDLAELALCAPALRFLELPDIDQGAVVRRALAFFDALALDLASPAEIEARAGSAVFLLELLASCFAPAEPLFATPPPRYLLSGSGKLYFICIDPQADFSSLRSIERPLESIRAEVEAVRREFLGVEIGVTGKPALQADELASSAVDMARAALLAVFLVALLFMFTFKSLRLPASAVLALACGIGWTFGAATLLVGQLNLLSIVFAIILVGLGIDFGIHLVSRYLEERRGADPDRAITRALATAGKGNLTGALTSSIAFFGTMLGDFEGLRELGLIAGAGLLLCLLAMLTVLPALILLAARKSHGELRAANWAATEPVLRAQRAVTRHPALLLAAACAISLLMAGQLADLRFEDNLLELQAVGLDSVEWEHRIIEDSADATWFGAITTGTLAELREVVDRAHGMPSVGAVHSVFDMILDETPDRLAWRRALHEPHPDAAPAGGAERPMTGDDLREAGGRLRRLAVLAAFRSEAHAARLRDLADRLAAVAARLGTEPELAAEAGACLDRQARVIGEMLAGDAAPLREALPHAVRDTWVSPNGRYLAMVHPSGNVWEYEALGHFVADLRAIDPDATGVPMTQYESIGDMRAAFRIAALAAAVLVILVVWLDFRGFRDPLLAIVPVALGMLWLAELMAALDLHFNLANFFSVPILIGIGVDNGVHILHRYRETGRVDALGATRRAVVLTSITTMIGFGCMVIASHRGLQSLGIVMALGSFTCLCSTLLVLVPILAWTERRRASGGRARG